ncbi:hypothetical protein DD238_006106 [Peronospora effusa]|uniref:Uncharacterized protein n=1 Tax=Peronospora effusa TaxID=542832 RepID=A0A3M6VED3_9STRA|nr:hypothetical protein DD238_006106 [Peronospora effusa]
MVAEDDRTGPQCTRIDCTLYCKEADRLRGDLLKNRWKNKHLREQLIALQSYTSKREAKTQQTLQRKDDEILRLSKKVAGLTMKLQQQFLQNSSIEKPFVVPLKQNVDALETCNAVFESNYEDVHAWKERKSAARMKSQRQVIQVVKERTDKQSELYTTLKMNEMLRDEVVHVQKAKKKLLNQVEQSLMLVAAIQNQVERYRDAVGEHTLEITQLQTKVKQLESEKLLLKEKLVEIDERKTTNANALASDTKAVLIKKAVFIDWLGELRRKLMQHDQHQRHDKEEKDTVCVSVSTATGDLENQLEMLQELCIRDNSTIFELSLQQRSDAESRVELLDIDAAVESAIQAAVQKQPQPVGTRNDDRSENLRALDAAKATSQQQERVCYHLRPEVTCSKSQDGDEDVWFATVKDEGFAFVKKNNKHESRQAERRTNVTGRGKEHLASSEGRASVDELQHQLMQIKVTYQQFRVQYDLLTEKQQQTILEYQRLVPEMEKTAQKLNVVREKSNDKIQILENAICMMNDRDWTARNTKWKAFRKRLNALEDAIQVEQLRRKQLNKDFENEPAQLPLRDLRRQCGYQSETGQLKSQVDASAIRDRLLIGQLQAASNTIVWKENKMRLQAELFETRILNEDLNWQLELVQSRNYKLLRLNGELEAEKRELRSKYEDLELGLQNASTRLLGRLKLQQRNQRDEQVTIASLTQLLNEKNTLINEYQRKLAIVQVSSAQDKAHARLETTQLTEENQRMIAQLKKTMIAVRFMEGSGKSKQALQAVQEHPDHVLQEWKQAEVALNNARQSIREFQIKQKVLQNERDLAEARAMEALEETVLMRENEGKLKLLCEAIIKLKEEFLTPEDIDAVEFAKAQEVVNQDMCARKRKEDERREDEEKNWQEEKTQLQSQVQILQKELALLEIENQQQRTKRNAEKERAEDKKSAFETDLQALRDEVERVKCLLTDQVVGEARAVKELEGKFKALQAQNVALRVASTHAPVASIDVADAKEKCEQVEKECKLQRRVEILTLRLKEKEGVVANKDKDFTRYGERVLNLESEVQERHEKEHLTQNASAPAATSVSAKQHVEELEFQNAFFRETLALSRKDWEESFYGKMTSSEAQFEHLRWQLVQNGVSLNNSAPGHEMNDTIGHGSNLRTQREGQHFFVGQEVQEEILAHSHELRNKKQHVVAKDTRLLELELENKSLRLEYMRLRRKIRCGSGDLPDSKNAQKQLRGAKGIGSGDRRSLRAAHEWVELEDVVKKMKFAIEELRAENNKLKKAAKSRPQYLLREEI